MNLQEYIGEALQDLIQARTYISTNSITVARHVERDVTEGDIFVEIECDGEERLSNNHNLYMMEVGIRAVHKMQQDINGVSIDALWADISDFTTQDLTVSALQTAITSINASSGITVAGFNYLTSDIQNLDQYEFREQRLVVAFTFTN